MAKPAEHSTNEERAMAFNREYTELIWKMMKETGKTEYQIRDMPEFEIKARELTRKHRIT